MSGSAAASARAQPPPRRQRRLLATLLLRAPLFIIATAISGACAITCRPSWYVPQAVDYARLPEDKRLLVALVDGIGAALQTPQTHVVELTTEQINRWIVGRNELSPEEWLDVKLPNLSQAALPHVSFVSGDRIRVAMLVESNGIGTVASVVLHVRVTADEVRVAIDDVRLGWLPVPRGFALSALRAWQRDGRELPDLAADGSWRFPNDFIWPNGKRRFYFSQVSTTDNRLRVEIAHRPNRP